MAEYIDREALIKALEADYNSNWSDVVQEYAEGVRDEYDDVLKIICKQPVKRGRWFHINNDSFIYCSECNNEAYWDTDYGQQLFDYCPYCGARMDGEQK